MVYFKQEQCFVVVASKNIEAAQMLLDKARYLGWRRSGIMASRKRVVIELMGTEKLELPIMNKKKILVSDDYLKILVKEANSRLERSREKIRKLEKVV